MDIQYKNGQKSWLDDSQKEYQSTINTGKNEVFTTFEIWNGTFKNPKILSAHRSVVS